MFQRQSWVQSMLILVGWKHPDRNIESHHRLGPTPQYANITIVWTLMSSVSLLIIGRVTDIFGEYATNGHAVSIC